MTIRVIAHWTLRQLLRSWTGILGGVGFVFMNALVLWMLLNESSNPILGTGTEVHQVLMPQYLSTMALLLMLLSPIIHMNSIAGDVAEGQWTLYQTVPVSNLDVVLGKWTGLCAYSGLLLLPTIPSILWINQYTELLWNRWFLGFVSLLIFGCWLHALGIWVSSRCKRPWTAWMISAGCSLILWFLGSFTGTVWVYLSPMPKIQEMLDGWLNLADGFFWISTISGFLYWSQDALAEKYWTRRRPFETRIQPWMWAVVLCLSNAVGLRYNQYWDFNSVRQTLFTESIQLLEDATSPVVFSIQMSPHDPRRAHLDKWLRSIEHLPMVDIKMTTQLETGLSQRDGLYIEHKGKINSITGVMVPDTIHQTLKSLLRSEDTVLCVTQGGGEPNLFDVLEADGMGLWTEILLNKGYKPQAISGHTVPEEQCQLIAIIGRNTPLEQSWLDETQNIPTLILLDPTQEAIPTEWFQTIGVIIKDDFVVEPNPQFQIANNPTTLMASQINFQQHPVLQMENHQILLQTMRSIQWNPQHTQHLGLELLHTSPQSWAEVDYTLENPEATDGIDIIGHVPIMVEVSVVNHGIAHPQWIIMGSSSLLKNHFLERNPFNGQFAIQMLTHLQGGNSPVHESTPEDVRISFSSIQLKQFIWLWIVGLPIVLLSVFSRRHWHLKTK